VGLAPTPLLWVQLYLQPVPNVELGPTPLAWVPTQSPAVCRAPLALSALLLARPPELINIFSNFPCVLSLTPSNTY